MGLAGHDSGEPSPEVEKRIEAQDVVSVLHRYCDQHRHSNHVEERWLATESAKMCQTFSRYRDKRFTVEETKAIAAFELEEVSDKLRRNGVEAQTLERRQRQLEKVIAGTPASAAVIAVMIGSLFSATWLSEAVAQRIHKYHFECIGAGFTSQQCEFLASVLRRYGIQ